MSTSKNICYEIQPKCINEILELYNKRRKYEDVEKEVYFVIVRICRMESVVNIKNCLILILNLFFNDEDRCLDDDYYMNSKSIEDITIQEKKEIDNALKLEFTDLLN